MTRWGPKPGHLAHAGRPVQAASSARVVELPRIPAPVGALVAAFPQYPHAALLSAALNLFARNLFAADEVARLDGKVIALHVRDAGLRLTLRIARNGYAACHSGTAPDATVSADAREFLLLALGSADPDTLFFDRRLTIAGDTEVGLLVKNALDRVTLPLPARLLQFLGSRLT